MTSRGIKFSSNDDERQQLLSSEVFEDDFEVRYSGDQNYVKKKRTRKLSDEVHQLIDAGNAPSAPPLDQCVEAELQPGDTLASTSLKYNIPVAELKRVNNILAENQFYALKRIKIPIKTASLLTELLPSVHQAKGEAKLENGWFVRDLPSPVQTGGTSSTVPSSPPSENEFELVHLNHSQPESLPSKNGGPASKQTKKVKRFLKNVDKDLARIKEKLDIDDDDSSDGDTKINGDSASVLLIRGESVDGDRSTSKPSFVDTIRASQSRTACCMFLVIITVVIVVILIFAHQEFEFIEENHQHHHHHHHDSKNHSSSDPSQKSHH